MWIWIELSENVEINRIMDLPVHEVAIPDEEATITS